MEVKLSTLDNYLHNFKFDTLKKSATWLPQLVKFFQSREEPAQRVENMLSTHGLKVTDKVVRNSALVALAAVIALNHGAFDDIAPTAQSQSQAV